MAAKKNGTQKTISHNLLIKIYDISQNFYFYRILNNENFTSGVEQTNFVTHLIIITEQLNLFIDYLKTRLLKFGQISFNW